MTRYTEILSEEKKPNGALVYAHRLIDGTRAPEAAALLRKTLAARSQIRINNRKASYRSGMIQSTCIIR